MHGIKRADLPLQNVFWSLTKNYNGAGSFIPFEEGGKEGKFSMFIESDKSLILEQLREEFPSLELNGLVKSIY